MHDGYYGSGTILINYYKKYGHILGETITKEILEINNSKEENACREKYWVGDLYNTDPMCINLCGGGMGSMGHIVSEETKKKISKSCKGRKVTEKQIEALINRCKGKPSWNKGKPFSEEAKQHMSDAHKGKKMGGNNPFSRKIIRIDINTGEEMYFDSLSDAARYMNKKLTNNISQCLRGKTKTAYGYRWRYA